MNNTEPVVAPVVADVPATPAVAPPAAEVLATINPAPADPTTPAAAPAPATPVSDPGWLANFTGEDLGYLQNRGLADKTSDEALVNLVAAQRSAEKKLGLPADRLLTLPADKTSEGAMDPIWSALGRPDTAGGYEIDKGDTDLSKSFADTLSTSFYEAGLTKDQSGAVFGTVGKFLTDIHTNEEQMASDQRALGMTALKDEWGETLYDLNVNIAKEAAAASGASKELIAKLAMAFDPDKGDALVIKFFNQIGQKRGLETPFVSGDGQVLGLGATTPEAAKARITELKSDPEWVARFNAQKHNSDSPIMKEYRGLISLAAKLMD